MAGLCGLLRLDETAEKLYPYNGIVEVVGSIPSGSTNNFNDLALDL